MNTDVGDLLKRIKMPNPIVAGGIGLLVVAIVAATLVGTRLANNWLGATQAEAALADVQESIDRIKSLQTANPEAIRQQISQTNLEIAALLQGFPTGAEAADQASRLYEYAMETGVQLVSLEQLRSTLEEEMLTAYTVQRYNVVAQGGVPELLRFVSRLGSLPLPTLRVTNVSIQSTDWGRADIDLVLYASDVALEERGALAAANSSVRELEQLAQMARYQQSWSAVVSYTRRILELEPAHVEASLWAYEAQIRWANELETAGDLDSARERYEAARQIRPEGQEAVEGLERLANP